MSFLSVQKKATTSSSSLSAKISTPSETELKKVRENSLKERKRLYIDPLNFRFQRTVFSNFLNLELSHWLASLFFLCSQSLCHGSVIKAVVCPTRGGTNSASCRILMSMPHPSVKVRVPVLMHFGLGNRFNSAVSDRREFSTR